MFRFVKLVFALLVVWFMVSIMITLFQAHAFDQQIDTIQALPGYTQIVSML